MLEPYSGQRRPIRFGVYDLEWIPETLEVRLVGVRDERGFRSYRTVLEFLRGELTSRNRGKVWFAHAGGLADVQFVLSSVIQRANPNFRVEGSWSGSSLIRCKVKAGKNAWTFADSYWLLRDSLERIGKSVGLEKLGDSYQCPEHPRCGHEGKCVFYAPLPILERYNQRDCEILYQAIDRFQAELLDLGGLLRQTIASSALTLFRAAYLRQPIPTDRRVNEIARNSYVASRVEVFQRDAGPGRGYDINSSFPHSMTFGLPGELESVSRTWKGETCSIVDATIEVEHEIPPVPYRSEGRIFFPSGSWRSWFTGDDLHLVLESGGTIRAVHEVMNFRPFFDLGGYVRDIYRRRKESTDEFARLVYKYLLNSLYGKLAETEEKAELLINPPSRPKCAGRAPCTRARCFCVEQFAPGIFKVGKQVEIKHAHVPIAACVTAKSRALLTRSLWQAKPYYCDTDSNYTASTMPESSELGRFKLEKEIEGGTFLSPKLYRTWPGPTIRSKGFRRLTSTEFDALASGEGITIRRMVRIAENFRGGNFDPREEEFVKHALSHLTARELAKLGISPKHVMQPKRCALEGGRTRPWDVEELAK